MELANDGCNDEFMVIVLKIAVITTVVLMIVMAVVVMVTRSW